MDQELIKRLIKIHKKIAKYGVTQRIEEWNIKSYGGFKIGDTVTIIKPPFIWSGSIKNTKYPLHLQYPFTGLIEEIKIKIYVEKYGWISKIQQYKFVDCKINGYGFCLSSAEIPYKNIILNKS